MSILRPYQRQAVTAAWAAISPDVNRVLIEMATGLGKTITFATQIDEWLADQGIEPGQSAPLCALVLVHTDELVRQAVDKINVVTKGRWTIGVVKAAQNDVHADIIVASVQTLARPGRKQQIHDVGLIIVDEAHHATARTYVDILQHYGAIERGPARWDDPPPEPGQAYLLPGVRPSVPVFGYTATPARSDGQGLGHVWQVLAFSRSLTWGIRHGYLIDLVPYTIKIPELRTAASDSVLDAALCDSIAPEVVADAWLEKVDYPGNTDDASLYRQDVSTVLFAPLVRSARAFANAFNEVGVKAEVVHGAMPPAERQAVLARYDAGVTTVLCNAMVLTEGWDSPRTMCVIVARPTQGVPLFVQMVGRGPRPWLSAEAPPREEQRCILLCVAGTTTDLATVADLSDNIGEVTDGKSLLQMEDEWDIGRDIVPDEPLAYRGPVRVEQWDAIVQASSKAWKYTEAGVPFLPTMMRGNGYVFVVDTAAGFEVWSRMTVATRKAHNARLATAPDLELAMAIAEDEAQERGGDIGALLADKTRPWRKAVPSLEMLTEARRVGVDESAIARVLSSKSAGKAGKLSDLIDKVTASRVLDPNVTKIKERARA